MLRVNHFKQFQTIFQNPRQSYNFFLKLHSQIVQFYSQIVQICIFSSQLVPISPNWSKKVKKKQKTVATNVTTEIGKTLLEIVMPVLERCLAGNLLEDAVEGLFGGETA